MRTCSIWLGITLAWFSAGIAGCQPSIPGAASPQIRKEWTLGEHVARDLDSRDGRIDDPEILSYLLNIENRLSTAAGKSPIDIRLTQSSTQYAHFLPNKVLYISAGLLEYIQSEMELAGLIAHELAHADEPAMTQRPGIPVIHHPACILTSPLVALGWAENMLDKERRANAAATAYLKAAGYDPSGVLDLFSKLAYEHPVWGRAIVADDLLRLRAEIESDTIPPSGHIIDSSRFRQMQAKLASLTGHSVKASRTRPTLERR